jgi:intein/homing endonuclease
MEVVDHAMKSINNIGYKCYTKEWHKGAKGNYIEIRVRNSGPLRHILENEFGGINKSNRSIPSYIFNASRSEKLSFLAGMIDADGYINNSDNIIKVQLGSTNEELALQQMKLAMDLGFDTAIYKNNYTKRFENKIRYNVEFNCSNELVEYLVCEKKKIHFDENRLFLSGLRVSFDICEVNATANINEIKYSYDVTTESEHFSVNGIYSHNCRSFLTIDRFSSNSTIGNISNAKNYVPNKHKYWGRSTTPILGRL